MVHPSCVQTAVIALMVPWLTCATRKAPLGELTNAAPPTAASAEPAGTFTVIALFPATPVRVVSCGCESLGEVGLPPPHPSSSEPTAMSEAIWQALTQKPRRFMGGRFATRVPGCRYDRVGYSRIWKSGNCFGYFNDPIM